MPRSTLPNVSRNARATGSVSSAFGPLAAVRRRRQLPLIVAGVVLVVGSALAFATAELRLAGADQVLVVGRSLPAGHLLARGDLGVVRLRTAAGVASLPASAAPALLGRPLAVPVVSGALLSAGEVGTGHGLPAGMDVVALALRPGQFPPSLASGDSVVVVDTGVPSAAGTAVAAATGPAATVTALDPTTAADATTVVSVQLSQADAAALARLGAAGRAALVLTAAAGTGP